MTNPPKTADVAKVEQCDREAAAAQPIGRWYREHVLAGQYDSLPIVQAFARHRHQALSPARGEGKSVRIARDEAVRALEVIRGYTDADEPTSYRADDREGCLDGVFSEADRALHYIAKLDATDRPTWLSEQPRPSAPEVSGDREAVYAKTIHDVLENDDDSEGGGYLRAARAILALSPTVSAEVVERLRAALEAFDARKPNEYYPGLRSDDLRALLSALSPAASVSAEVVERLRRVAEKAFDEATRLLCDSMALGDPKWPAYREQAIRAALSIDGETA